MDTPHCPKCQQQFPGHDYCPNHGVRLVVSAASGQSLGPAALPTTDNVAGARPEGDLAISSSKEKLAALMKRFSLRAVGESEVAEPSAGRFSLPEELREAGWQIVGGVTSHSGIDRWPLTRLVADEREEAIFSVYRLGALTGNTCYQHIQSDSSAMLPTVLAYGTLDLTGGARADYDLTIPPADGDKALDIWLADTQAGEERACYLLAPLAALLQSHQKSGIHAIVLEPSNLVLTDDARLLVKTAGALALIEQDNQMAKYRPEFARNPLLPQNWTAPEVVQQSVLSPNSPLFSVGQLLAMAIFGQSFTLTEVQAGAIPFHAIADRRLSRILMGCLYPKPAERWSNEDFLSAVTCPIGQLPSVGPWSSLVPGAAGTAFSLAGQSFWRLEDLLETATLPSHWDEALARIDDLLAWSMGTNWVGEAELLVKQLAAGRTPDYALLRLAHTVCPAAPQTWRGIDLSDAHVAESLGALGQAALRRDPAAVATVQAFFSADLREALIE